MIAIFGNGDGKMDGTRSKPRREEETKEVTKMRTREMGDIICK